MDREFWSSFTHDPRDAQYQSIRASDQDRGVVQQALTEAYADGRLDREEFDERSEQATGARTLGELSPIVADLVSPRPGRATAPSSRPATPAELHQRAVEKYGTDRREAVFGFLFATLICTVIWLAHHRRRRLPVAGVRRPGHRDQRRQDGLAQAGHRRRPRAPAREEARQGARPAWSPDDKASE